MYFKCCISTVFIIVSDNFMMRVHGLKMVIDPKLITFSVCDCLNEIKNCIMIF